MNIIESKAHADTVWLAMSFAMTDEKPPNIRNENELAHLFADCYKHVARYNRTAKEWWIYTGARWEQDTGGCYAAELAKDFYKRLWQYMWNNEWSKPADDESAQERMEAQQRAVSSLHKLKRRKTLLEDARSVYPFSTEDLDADPWVLNCPNYTIDLRTGECHEHTPEDMLSHVCGADYDPTAKAPRFLQFVQEIFSEPTLDGYEDRPGLAAFAQKALGYSLTGSVAEDCLFMLYGPATRNGKTTLTEAIMGVMGDYAVKAKPDTLAYTGKPNASGASEDVARLKGKRFVSISEPNKTMHLDAAKVKDLTGGGTQVARFLHENSFEFQPEFKIFIDTNYRPRVTDETLFSSGRVHVLPFERHFSTENQDKGLSEKLAEERSGILNWMLEGLQMYLTERHLKPCAESIKATEEYREDSDKIGQFWQDRMEESKENSKGGAVYKEFCDWCADANIHPQPKGLFFDDLRKRGLMQPCAVNGMMDKNGVKGWKIRDDWKELTDNDAPPVWRDNR